MTRSKFQDILRNLDFSDNTKDDENDKGCKIRSLSSFHITVLVKGYLYQFDLHSGKKESEEENLGPGVVLKITESLQNSHSIYFLIISSTVSHLLSSFMIEFCMVFAILKRIGKECRGIPVDRKMKADDIEYLYSEKVAISSYKVAVTGLLGVQ